MYRERQRHAMTGVYVSCRSMLFPSSPFMFCVDEATVIQQQLIVQMYLVHILKFTEATT